MFAVVRGGVATLAAPPAAAAARCTSAAAARCTFAALNALHAAQDSKEAPIEASAMAWPSSEEEAPSARVRCAAASRFALEAAHPSKGRPPAPARSAARWEAAAAAKAAPPAARREAAAAAAAALAARAAAIPVGAPGKLVFFSSESIKNGCKWKYVTLPSEMQPIYPGKASCCVRGAREGRRGNT